MKAMYGIEDYKEEEHVTYINPSNITVRYHQYAADPVPRWATDVQLGDNVERNTWKQRVHITDKFVDMSGPATLEKLQHMSKLRQYYDNIAEESAFYLDELLELIPGV